MVVESKIQLRKQSKPSRFLKNGCPWVFSNELVSVPTSIQPGSWVELEDSNGQVLAYGHFNPHSVLAFRVFERSAFRNDQTSKKEFFKRLDSAHALRTKAYASAFEARQMGKNSFRLAFGESDGLPGLVIDLYESNHSGFAVIQCHSAGADQFLDWAKQWLEEKLQIRSGMVRNDLDVRNKEKAPLFSEAWGKKTETVFAFEGGVKFFVDTEKGQKTGYFYDHRDNRTALSNLAAQESGAILDCFSYMGSWGLQAIQKNKKLKLFAVDVSAPALENLMINARENGLGDRVEIVEADFFKNQKLFSGQKFEVVVVDPPALTSSAKHAKEGQRALENCFFKGMGFLKDAGTIAFASCSYHLSWDEFLWSVSKTGLSFNKALRIAYLGSQSLDHPMLATLPESRYLKCAIAMG